MTTGFGKALGPGLIALAALSLAACVVPPPRAKSPPSTTGAKSPPAKPPPAKPGSLATAPRAAPVAPVTVTAVQPDASSAGAAVYAPAQATLGQGVHVVARGDTLYAVSRRYRVPVRAIIDHNGLRPPYPLKVGQRLRIPVPRRHVVTRKETVYGISRRYGVPLRSVIDANDLAPPYALRIGQTLVIPMQREHLVAKGETVYSISRRYGVELTELVRLNRIAPPYTIRPAQRLMLPDSRPAAPVAAGVSAGPAGKTLVAVRPARAAPLAIPQPAPRAGNKFLWPVKGRIILGYGPKQNGLHNDGINIKAPRGAPIRAAENGVVAYVGNELRGFGNLVLIKHAGGWVTAYAHTDQVLVRRGDKVRRGQTIGRVGSTGNVASPQLHFEVRKGTQAVDPMRMLAGQTAAG
jgi:murein DD-endopeptidase MepM/ murein hydrolase activator NlpD